MTVQDLRNYCLDALKDLTRSAGGYVSLTIPSGNRSKWTRSVYIFPNRRGPRAIVMGSTSENRLIVFVKARALLDYLDGAESHD